ncbi:MAG: SUMF1/EgtB/PvdO family nonheme iron enzyme [Hyphomonas sp.]|nr:SUMF1/EgtB/PvdO family nonheme iron enzyme [Hyphomonas sp.]
MSHIFLSYSRADRPIAQVIAEALEAEGFSVWWDKVLRAGQTYDEVTENMLRDSAVVVVLWSQTSVKSKWVRAEATLGQRSCEMVPAMIEEADRPIMFELTQTADLIGWNGDRNEARWAEFVGDIKRSLEKHTAAETAASAVAAPASPTAQNDATIETVFWTSIKDGDDPADFEAYLSRYPDGHYESLARNRLAAVQAAAGVATPASEAPEPAPPEPKPVPQHAAPARAVETPKPAEKKKSSSPVPMLIGVAAVLGVGGWFGWQAINPPESATDSDVQPPPPPPVASCTVCPDMVDLPGGSFTMGSPDNEANRSGNEGPQREVTLRPFSISATEITRQQWQLCADAGACRADPGGDSSEPVTRVSYDDAVAYTTWLSQQGERRYRLPSEAQWEYAARGGTSTPYWWGSSFPGKGAVSGGISDTVSLPDNPFGVSGMLGNVREWVADCYVNNYADAPSDGRVVNRSGCQLFVVRGGSWRLGAAEHRAANRARNDRSVRDRSLGFRVVAEPVGN